MSSNKDNFDRPSTSPSGSDYSPRPVRPESIFGSLWGGVVGSVGAEEMSFDPSEGQDTSRYLADPNSMDMGEIASSIDTGVRQGTVQGYNGVQITNDRQMKSLDEQIPSDEQIREQISNEAIRMGPYNLLSLRPGSVVKFKRVDSGVIDTRKEDGITTPLYGPKIKSNLVLITGAISDGRMRVMNLSGGRSDYFAFLSDLGIIPGDDGDYSLRNWAVPVDGFGLQFDRVRPSSVNLQNIAPLLGGSGTTIYAPKQGNLDTVRVVSRYDINGVETAMSELGYELSQFRPTDNNVYVPLSTRSTE